MSKRIKNALISRGFNSKLSEKLIAQGYTLSKLKQESKFALEKLGLTSELIDNLKNEIRPPIPQETVVKLLHESRYCCCICRDNTNGIIIHHIEEWSKSHDHSENNIIVLCPNHHDLAHSKKDLSLNLTKSRLIELKNKWIEEVKYLDNQIIIGLTKTSYSRWDYFNHKRVFELYFKFNIDNSNFKTTETVKQLGLINSIGTFEIKKDKRNQLYDFGNGYLLYYYMQELFSEIILNLPIIDITDKYNRTDINSLIKVGSIIALQAGFYFKDISKTKDQNQNRKCYYQKEGILVEFIFDAYEATSNSSWAVHLAGHKTATVIGFVTSLINESNKIIITISSLAIGCYMDEHPYRKIQYYS